MNKNTSRPVIEDEYLLDEELGEYMEKTNWDLHVEV